MISLTSYFVRGEPYIHVVLDDGKYKVTSAEGHDIDCASEEDAECVAEDLYLKLSEG